MGRREFPAPGNEVTKIMVDCDRFFRTEQNVVMVRAPSNGAYVWRCSRRNCPIHLGKNEVLVKLGYVDTLVRERPYRAFGVKDCMDAKLLSA